MQHDKFSLAEMTSDSATGKTSMGKVGGAYLIFVGSVMLLYATFFIRDANILSLILLSGSGMIPFGTGLILGKIIKPSNKVTE